MTFYSVTLEDKCAGVNTDKDGKITLIAPCFHWSKGKHFSVLKRWVENNGGHVQEVTMK